MTTAPADLHTDDRAETSDAGDVQPYWLVVAHRVLLCGYLIFTFVGTRPLAVSSVSQRVEGNPLDRIVIFAFLALSIPIIASRWRMALDCVRSNPLLYFVVALSALSIVWSDYPELTLRRAMLLLLLTTIATAIAIGEANLRKVHTLVFATLTGVILLNLFCTAVWPSLAISDIGVTGLYRQKNVAGMVALITLIIDVTWMMGCRTPKALAAGLVATAFTVLFLAITLSKTSIGLAVLALAVGLLFLMADRFGPRFVYIVMAAGFVALSTALAVFALSGFDTSKMLGFLVADTSFTGRDQLWSFAWHSASQRMWLGHGYGAFWDVGEANDPLVKLEPGTWLGDVDKGVINQAHNGYLELWLHLGLPATVIAVVSVMAGIRNAMSMAIPRSNISGHRAALAAIALILLIYLLHNLTEATLFMRSSPFCNMAIVMQLLATRRSSVESPTLTA